MPLSLPDLDVRRYDDLVAEMRALIPQFAPGWSNHNAADPGITFIELLAWLTEATLYRLNRTPDATQWNLVRLLRPEGDTDSPRWDDLKEQSLSSARIQALQWFNEPYRAVTAGDFERLVLSATFGDDLMDIARVKAVANHQSGIVTVIIVPRIDGPITGEIAPKFAAVRDAVKELLDQRRLVGTRVRVRAPSYTAVAVSIDVLAAPDTSASDVKQAVGTAIETLLHPVHGGTDGRGWPFGRPVSIHDLAPVVESVPGVAAVRRVLLDGDPVRTESAIKELPRIGTLNVTAEPAATG